MRVFWLGLVALALPLGGMAERVRLEYSVHADHFHVLDGAFRLDLRDGRYLLEGDSHTTGMLGFFFPYRVSVWSAGMLADDAVAPGSFGNRGSSSREYRQVEMVYDNGGPRVMTLLPGPEDDEREPVPEDMHPGTIDPLSATVLVARRVTETGECPAMPERIFDGRRLFTLSLDPLEAPLPDDLELPGEVVGPVVACALDAEQLAGHWTGERGRWSAGPFQRREESEAVPTVVWFGRLDEQVPMVPLAVERDGGWRILMQLTGFEDAGVN